MSVDYVAHLAEAYCHKHAHVDDDDDDDGKDGGGDGAVSEETGLVQRKTAQTRWDAPTSAAAAPVHHVDASNAHTRREARLTGALVTVGVSVISGAVSTLGASLFLFFPLIQFFVQFGTAIFVTIGLSLVWSLLGFASMLAVFGPQGSFGHFSFQPLLKLCSRGEKPQ
jgi:hypothetical protein